VEAADGGVSYDWQGRNCAWGGTFRRDVRSEGSEAEDVEWTYVEYDNSS